MMIPLDEAYDALSDLARRFYNEMLHAGVKELPVREWAEEFRSWIDAYEFERNYQEDMKMLAEWKRRNG